MIKDLEENERTLEEEKEVLKTDASMKKSELLSLFLTVPADVRSKVSENLKDLV